MSIGVLIVDDQTIIRDGLKSLLSAYADIEVVGDAANGREAYELTCQLQPDVVLMDIRMPDMDGVEATRLIKKDFPQTVIIVLTTFDDDDYIINALTYGAAGYLLKDISGEKLVEAIRDGLSGNIILPGRVAAKITSRLAQESTPRITREEFTERELEVITLLVQGKSNKEIAETLSLTVGTVKNYISQIYAKINVKDRANAVLVLKKMGL
ncbi:MAG: response regulator transcription factor [Firmicutes bacterium]|nr:response regulator transcription factor [Bacillota bacterium]